MKTEDAPKSFADLLDPKWAGKMVKAHPAYSGTIMNATFQIARDLGWDYFEKLAKQSVMQVQSATDTPKKIALGERAIMVDGAGYLVIRDKEAGKPVDVIYPAEGTPLATSPSAVFKAAPNPNAARLFQNWMHSREGQQILVDFARQYSPHKQTVEKPGVRKLADIKLMKEDPEGVEKRRRGDQEALRADLQGVMKRAIINGVMAGLVPAIHVLPLDRPSKGVDARHKAGHDELNDHRNIRPEPRTVHGFDTPLVLYGFAAVLCLLILLPMSWLVYYAFTDTDGAFTLNNFTLFTDPTLTSRSSPPSPSRPSA